MYAEIRERSVDTCAHALKEAEAHAQSMCTHALSEADAQAHDLSASA